MNKTKKLSLAAAVVFIAFLGYVIAFMYFSACELNYRAEANGRFNEIKQLQDKYYSQNQHYADTFSKIGFDPASSRYTKIQHYDYEMSGIADDGWQVIAARNDKDHFFLFRRYKIMFNHKGTVSITDF